MRLAKLASLALALTIAAEASAQTDPDKGLDRAESRLDRIERPERVRSRGVEGEEVKHWTLSFGLPFTFSSNVANSETNPDQAFHGDPSITLGGEWDLGGGATLFIEGSADTDFYTNHSVNDNATLSGQIGIKVGDPSKGMSPYAHYTVLSLYTGQYDAHDVTVHHFTLGVKRSWPAGEHAKFSLDANLMRRESPLVAVEQNRGTLTLKLAGDLSEDWSWSLSGRGQYVDYTGGASKGREDQNLRLLGVVTHTVDDTVSLDFSLSFQRNWSNRVGKSYSVWDIGPNVGISIPF